MTKTHIFNINFGDEKAFVSLDEMVKDNASTYDMTIEQGELSINDNELEDILINTSILSENKEGVEVREVNGVEMTISYELNCKLLNYL